GPVPGAATFRGNAQLQVATARGAGLLAAATPTLVTNHPAYFVTSLAPALEFAPGAAAVVEGRVGEGRFVAISDPSVLINNMLELTEDRRFAGGLVAATCRRGQDRIVLLSGEFAESGAPPVARPWRE